MNKKSPTKLEAWLMALRLRTLPIPTIQVVTAVGAAYASTGLIDGTVAFLSWLIALLITMGTNLLNDVFDFEKGGDPLQRFGQIKVIRAGWLSQKEVRRGGLIALSLAVVCSLFLGVHAGATITLIVLVSALMGYCYTGGPFPISYLGLSEIFIVLFYGGVCVLTCFYLQTGSITKESIVLALQMGLLAVVPNALNNFRDIYEDAEMQKNTLAVRFGKNFARWEISLLLIVPLLINCCWWILGYPIAFLIPFLLLPLVIPFIFTIWRNDPSPQFAGYFKLSILIHFTFGLLITAGLLFGE